MTDRGKLVTEDYADRRTLAARLLGLLDLTSLGETDTPGQIVTLCASARSTHVAPAAVCVYPEHVTTARRNLPQTIRVATVVNFPDGGGDAMRVERETRRALAAGADEIDMVLPYRALLDGNVGTAAAAVRACRSACDQGQALKLILETGVLASTEAIRVACRIGIEEGADFLKTSTGKGAVNATPEAAAVMLDVIAESGGRCGFKAAGGIRSASDARCYLELAQARLGVDWIGPGHFRIGASALHARLLAMLNAST